MSLLDAALDLHHHGCSVVPTRTDGSKAPAISWKHGQTHRAELAQLETWFTGDTYDGLGVVCGQVSGNLEMLEVEGRATTLIPELSSLMADNGYADLWMRLCAGYLEQSPSGGLHWLYRVDGQARGNTKLARRPSTPDELAAHQDLERAKAHDTITDPTALAARLDKIDALTASQVPQVLVETRGEGGFTVTAPSAGRTHPTGKAWMLLAGAAATIPTITVDERDALYVLCSALDQMPEITEPVRPLQLVGSTSGQATGDRPGDDFNNRATWDDILTPHGWVRTKHFGGNCYGWVRPGKTLHDGISATTGRNDADNLYVFTSSTEFDTEKAYSKFAAHTLLNHHGDYTAAAKTLRAQGYGKPLEEPRPDAILDLIDQTPTTPTTATPGSNASESSTEVTPPGDGVRPTTVVGEPTTYTLTDDGNALRLVDTHGQTLRYCPEAGAWLHWSGHRWTWDTAGHIHERARSIARNLTAVEKPEIAHRQRSLSNIGLKGMVNVARTDHRIVVHPDQLDGRPYELNTPAGVINLRTGHLTDPDPRALHTRSTSVAPDFTTPAPRWQQFLADTFAGDPALTTYIQRLLGLSLIGTHLEQILPFGWGSGANGKSTLLNVAQGVVGTGADGYSIPAPAELLLASHQRSHPTELARLSGARLVVASELEDGERFAESRIKMLTGGENIAARFMGKDFFSFVPTHTIWLLANDQPAVRAGGPAFWRRLRLLPFVHVVPPAERVAGLDQQLITEEGPAILAWLIQGAIDYLADGLAEPDSVATATSSYERDQDTVARFVDERCERGPITQVMRCRVAELRQAYETWCRVEGETPVSAKALTQALTARFDVVSERSMSARFYAGIRVTDASSDEPDQPAEKTEGWWLDQ